MALGDKDVRTIQVVDMKRSPVSGEDRDHISTWRLAGLVPDQGGGCLGLLKACRQVQSTCHGDGEHRESNW